MRSFLPLAALGVVLMTGAMEAPGGYTRIGSGVSSCGAWSEHRSESNLPGPATHGSQAAHEEVGWVLGFLSGVGYVGNALDPRLDPLNNMDFHGLRPG
jgi:hypothetical protein